MKLVLLKYFLRQCVFFSFPLRFGLWFIVFVIITQFLAIRRAGTNLSV